jgi:phosphate transport system protein
VIRKHFTYLINDVRDDVLRLGDMVEQAFRHAVHSLLTSDTTTASWVIANDKQIDQARRNLEERVIALLATQQPIVARDLRLLLVISSIATELERMGDYAKGIARRVYRSPRHDVQISPLPSDLDRMTNLAMQMVHTSLEAFLHQDVELARSLGTADDDVDALEDTLRTELRQLIIDRIECLDAALDVRDVVHALERMADRATNIGEWVIFLVTSENEELNP